MLLPIITAELSKTVDRDGAEKDNFPLRKVSGELDAGLGQMSFEFLGVWSKLPSDRDRQCRTALFQSSENVLD